MAIYNTINDFITDNNLQCGNCKTQQLAQTQGHLLKGNYAIRYFDCLHCKVANIEIAEAIYKMTGMGRRASVVSIFVQPKKSRVFSLPENCPSNIQSDYKEAARLLPLSGVASAAFSRRCLQSILIAQGYKQKNLVNQIEKLVAETDPHKVIPTYLSQSIDAIRHFGNFSAHPISDTQTDAIIDVEPGEAEWCLQLIEELIAHYYVRPKIERDRIVELNKKLAASGKPQIPVPVIGDEPVESPANSDKEAGSSTEKKKAT